MNKHEKQKFTELTKLSQTAKTNQMLHKYVPSLQKRKWWMAELKRTIDRLDTIQKSNERNPEGCCKNAMRLLVKQVIFDAD